MSRRVLEAIRKLLAEEGVPWQEVEHSPVASVEEAARARGLPERMGAKSIVMKTDGVFRLFVMSGALALRSRLIRQRLGVRRTRFATPEELLELTGVRPGAVPPFGEPILPLELYADPALLDNKRIAFTPGVATVSILLAAADWQRVARPVLFHFTRTGRAAC